MKLTFAVSTMVILTAFESANAQTTTSSPVPPPPPPMVMPTPTPVRIADDLSKAFEGLSGVPVDSLRREQAYAKLLEGQRYVWGSERLRSRTGRQNNVRLAREAFRRSVELDPMLSEGYTALAELAVNSQTQDADEAIKLAVLSTRANPNNFGARRLLGRLYAFQARLTGGPFNAQIAEKSIAEWKHVVRLDARNAEGWALLSELYDRTGRTNESIDALRRWVSAAVPVDTRFYQMLLGGQNLTSESASIKLGSALLKVGRTREAIETLSLLVADEPTNFGAVDLLKEAVESADATESAIALQALQQAVSANPTNTPLINLLARVQARSGNLNDAAKLLRDASIRLLVTDRASAAVLRVSLAEIYANADRPFVAVSEFDAAFAARGIVQGDTLAEDEQEFATYVFEKMILTLKNANRVNEAKAAIERARKTLGKDDLFADKEMISLLRDSGNRPAALALVRSVRQRVPQDDGLLRLEATLLTETGNVDGGVALIKHRIEAATPPPSPVTSGAPGSAGESVSIAVPASDTFSNYLFISSLYTQANRGKEAIETANQAYAIARGSERKQIARLTLATAQQKSGDVAAAETTLRELLKETPGNPIALNNLGYFLLERNIKLQEALELIQQAVKLHPTNSSYLDSLGWAYFRLGKFAEAERYLKEARRQDPSSGTIHEHLGDVYQQLGKTPQAKESWGRALGLFSEPSDVARVKKKLAGK